MSKKQGPLSGKVCVVTGAAERVGAVISRGLAAAGAMVVINHLHMEDKATELVSEIRAAGGIADSIDQDITETDAGHRIVAFCTRRYGHLDVLVHNASSFVESPFADMTPEEFDRSLGVNLRGPFFLSQAVGEQMRTQGYGRIIGILGNSLYESWPNMAAHSCSKVAMAKLLQILAVEYSPIVQVNGIAPGRILPSPAGQDLHLAQERGESEDLLPAGASMEKGSPEAVAEFLIQLIIAPTLLNGAIIPLDGGKSVI